MRTTLHAALLLGLSTLALAQGSPSRAAEVVNVGVIPIVDVAPIYLGKEKGFFSKRGIDVHLQLAQGGAALVPSVVSGQFQFGFSNLMSLLAADARGLDLKVVAAGVASNGKQGADFSAVVVPKDSPVQSMKDLEGKTVAINTLQNMGEVSIGASMLKAGGGRSPISRLN